MRVLKVFQRNHTMFCLLANHCMIGNYNVRNSDLKPNSCIYFAYFQGIGSGLIAGLDSHRRVILYVYDNERELFWL